ncbi:MAG: aldehyde dehydrogenase [Myxococcales bacterium]
MQAPLNVQSSQATSRRDFDRMLERLRSSAKRFARLDVAERVGLLSAITDRYFEQLDAMVHTACLAKGLDPESEDAGEEWLAHGLSISRYLRLLKQSLLDIAEHGRPRYDPKKLRRRENGAVSLKVYPGSTLEALTFPGISAEIYFQKGLVPEELPERQASFYRQPHDGRVALVLGAGNVASIPPKDALHKLFVEGEVTLLKVNPVNQYLGPFLEKAFAPAIEAGYFAVAYGDAEVGSYLTSHEFVDEVHITGSDRTHDLIVWGPPGPERDERRAQGKPLLQKKITSELGNVSAVLVVPGPWTEAELAYQAKNIAGMVTNNASFNCNAAKLLVQPRGWSGSGRLLSQIEQALAQTRTRLAYYPGAEQRFHRFTDGRSLLRMVGVPQPGELPWAIVPHLNPDDSAEPLFRNEPWCSVLGETEVGSEDPVDFLVRATRFVNERVWGNLNVALLVHPQTLRDEISSRALDHAIEELRYGTVAVNLWPAAAFILGSTPWGAHPSSTPADIQSGHGWSGNTLMFEGIEKTVVRAPFRMLPKPVWFPDHRTVGSLARRVVFMEKDADWRKLPAVALTAVRG